MPHYQAKKIVAGMSALISGIFLVFLYGNAFLGLVHFPVPSLALNWGMQNSANSGNYQENPTLTINKIGLTTPIIENVSVNNRGEYESALLEGVAMAKGTAGLESTKGNSFIFGHSSNLSLHPSRYDTIFASLPQLTPRDTIDLSIAGRNTEYQVVVSKAIKPDEVQYLRSDGQRMITLVTCWPLGTTYKRWVVQATKI